LADADLALEPLRALSGKQRISLYSNHSIAEVEIVRSIVAIIESYIEDESLHLAHHLATVEIKKL